jgi:hypothetical protein
VHLADLTSGSITPKLDVELDTFGWEIVTVAPIRSTSRKDGASVDVAAFGLVDKYNTLSGMTSSATEPGLWRAGFRCAGLAGFYVSDQSVAVTVEIGGKKVEESATERSASMISVRIPAPSSAEDSGIVVELRAQ